MSRRSEIPKLPSLRNLTNAFAMSASADLATADLQTLSKRELARLCRHHNLRGYGLKSQLLARLRAHRNTLRSRGTAQLPVQSAPVSSTSVPASSSSQSPAPTPAASRDSADAATCTFTPEQQAHIERLIASHVSGIGCSAGPSSTPAPPPPVTADALPPPPTHGGIGESAILGVHGV